MYRLPMTAPFKLFGAKGEGTMGNETTYSGVLGSLGG